MRSGRTVPCATSSSAAMPSGAVAERWPSSLRSRLEEFADLGIVLDDQDRRPCGEHLSAVPPVAGVPTMLRSCELPLRPGQRDLDGEDRALARLRADVDRDGPASRPDAARSRARGRGRGCARGRDCRADGTPRRSLAVRSSGMPMPVSQISMLSIPWRRRQPSRTLPRLVYFKCVRKQIADHLLEQARIAVDRKAARDHAQGQALVLARDR